MIQRPREQRDDNERSASDCTRADTHGQRGALSRVPPAMRHNAPALAASAMFHVEHSARRAAPLSAALADVPRGTLGRVAAPWRCAQRSRASYIAED